MLDARVRRSRLGLRTLVLVAACHFSAGSAAATPSAIGSCGAPATRIHELQGSGRSSPLAGKTGVVVEAVVVGSFAGASDGLGGFFLQEEDTDADADPSTSEGLFVFAPGLAAETAPSPGEVVRVRGDVQEYFGMTELSVVDAWIRCAVAGVASPAVVQLPIPWVDPASPSHWERWEGMRLRFAQPLFVVDQYAAGRFGEVELAGVAQLWQATQVAAPGPDAVAFSLDSERQRILLDDGRSGVDPDPWPYLLREDGDTLRLGDRVEALEGVLDFAFGRFRLQPTGAPRLRAQGGTASLPEVPGALRVVAWNLENLFNGDGQGGGFPTRGAASAFEYARQLDKIVATLAALDADVLALVELENDGVAAGSALADLAAALRGVDPELDYRSVDPQQPLGAQAIAVGLLYRPTKVAALGQAAVLDSAAHPLFDSQRNRPSLAQTFLHLEGGQAVTLVVNHFKSKGSSCAAVGDPDPGDGQGNCNVTRRLAARALARWLASDPTSSAGAPALIVGDLNAYPLEDPLVELADAGFVDLLALFDSPDAYSFVFDARSGRLDHALASPQLLDRVGGAAVWNVNSDESPALDYAADNPAGLYRVDPRRASDHDPLIVGLFPLPIPEPAPAALAVSALAVLGSLKASRRR